MTTNPPPAADLPEALSRQLFLYVMMGSVAFIAGILGVIFLIPITG
jgi:hypothetical protein